jgi:hypothetical protein
MQRLNQYKMTYRGKMMPESAIIEATSIVKAEEMGRKWCNEAPGVRRYVGMMDMVLLREELEPEIQAPQKPVMDNYKARTA